jgi:hypothetical protein
MTSGQRTENRFVGFGATNPFSEISFARLRARFRARTPFHIKKMCGKTMGSGHSAD